jgi:hypothetical protein
MRKSFLADLFVPDLLYFACVLCVIHDYNLSFQNFLRLNLLIMPVKLVVCQFYIFYTFSHAITYVIIKR